eukprot:350420-Chlamydomonas_euryale.AAC.3
MLSSGHSGHSGHIGHSRQLQAFLSAFLFSLSVPPLGSYGPRLPFCTMAMRALGLGLAWPDRQQLAKAELQEVETMLETVIQKHRQRGTTGKTS